LEESQGLFLGIELWETALLRGNDGAVAGCRYSTFAEGRGAFLQPSAGEIMTRDGRSKSTAHGEGSDDHDPEEERLLPDGPITRREFNQRYAAHEGEEAESYKNYWWSGLPRSEGQYFDKARLQRLADESLGHAAFKPYPVVDRTYPGLVVLCQHPLIFAIPNFISNQMCQYLMDKYVDKLEPWSIKEMNNGERQEVRLSKALSEEVAKQFRSFIDLPAANYELPDIVKYKPGEWIQGHVDSTPAKDRSTVMVAFIYLNDCVGGENIFDMAKVSIAPVEGLAVVHFPSVVSPAGNLMKDDLTHHRSHAARGEKWLFRIAAYSKPPGTEFDNIPSQTLLAGQPLEHNPHSCWDGPAPWQRVD